MSSKFEQRILDTRLPRQQAANLAANPRHSQELVFREGGSVMELGPDGMGLVPDRMRPALEGMRSDKIDWIRQSKRGPYVYKASQLASQLALSSLALNIRLTATNLTHLFPL